MFTRDSITNDSFVKDVNALARRADYMLLHTEARRVTHTASVFARLVFVVGRLAKKVQSDVSFTVFLKQALEHSHDVGGGSMRFVAYDDDTVWIEGSFHVSKLRERLLALPQSQITGEKIDG